jgi:hypothetical protein
LRHGGWALKEFSAYHASFFIKPQIPAESINFIWRISFLGYAFLYYASIIPELFRFAMRNATYYPSQVYKPGDTELLPIEIERRV